MASQYSSPIPLWNYIAFLLPWSHGHQHKAIGVFIAETDEMWNFVGKKANKQWMWIAMGAKTRPIIAFHVGDRSEIV